jgi:hypothetical protein
MMKDRYKGMSEIEIDFESRRNLGDAVLQIVDRSPSYPRNREPSADEKLEMAFVRELLSRLIREDFNVNLIDGLNFDIIGVEEPNMSKRPGPWHWRLYVRSW